MISWSSFVIWKPDSYCYKWPFGSHLFELIVNWKYTPIICTQCSFHFVSLHNHQVVLYLFYLTIRSIYIHQKENMSENDLSLPFSYDWRLSANRWFWILHTVIRTDIRPFLRIILFLSSHPQDYYSRNTFKW